MPPRIARSHAAASAPKASKASKINKGKKRQLDAFAIASHEAPEKLQIRQHRLGESFGEHPRAKRRRLQDDDEDSEGEEKIDSARMKQSRNVEKRTHGRKGGLDDENVEFGSDSEGNEWTMGGMGSEESDEEIDSDEAFGESDEERFDGWTFRGSKSGKGKPKKKVVKPKKQVDDDGDLDLNEDDEEEEEDEDEDSDFGGEGVDLATMLDDHDDDVLGGKDNTRKDFGEESASDEESSEGDDEQSDSSSDEEDDEPEGDERHARLQDFVDALDSKPADERERIVSGEDGGLTVDDLLADTELDKATMATFKPKRKSKAPQTLAAPLPKRQQDKIDREIATQKANEQLDRWRDTVMQNRRAEFLSFPLKRSDENEPIGKDKFIPAQEEKPRTELEASIQKIMEESGMATKKDGPGKAEDPESDLLKAEELALNKMPVEEMLRRRAELRQNRELLFREEAKAKRISKIKSKSYRRVHRKQRERDAEKERALLDPEGLGIPMDEDEKELADRRRAEARMGAKHKDSKWAKSLKATNRDVWDEGAREGALEQARRQEELKKRVAGRDVSDGSSDDSDDDDSDDGDNSGTLKKLEKLRGGEAPEKGIGAMKFMRDADARKKAKNDEALDALRKELAGMQSDDEDKEEENLGRAIFGPSKQNDKPAPKPKRPEMEEGDVSEDENEKPADDEKPAATEKKQDRRQPNNKGNKASGPLAKSQVPDRRAQEDNEEDSADQPNPWLAGPTKSKKSKADKQAQRDDDTTLVSLSEPIAKSKPAPKQKTTELAAATEASAPSSNGGWQTVPYNNNDSASSPEPETENPMLSAVDQKAALYARAFAGDDVKSAFDAEKADQAHSEDEKTVSTAMPGWGAWAGAGMSKSMKKTANRQRHNPLHKTKVPGGGVSQDKRKDKRLENVIVSEKSDRKGKKYLAPVLPHGFERGDEYERSLRQPIGKEWGTKEVVQRNTRPRVVVKPGAIIEAMERPLL
jgi:U3 small nucleolar RNA-associated protein 14